LPISETRKWKVNKSATQILELVNIELYRKNATIIQANSKRIEATLGSETRTRLFGGALVSEETLPLNIILQMHKSATETEVDATILGAIAFGIPNENPRQPPKKPLREIFHFDKW
jgi:hypothetical protein